MIKWRQKNVVFASLRFGCSERLGGSRLNGTSPYTERLYRVSWISAAPHPGMTVRLLYNKVTGGLEVCGMDLTILGRLLDRIVEDTDRGHFVAKVHTEPNRISLHRFGPASGISF